MLNLDQKVIYTLMFDRYKQDAVESVAKPGQLLLNKQRKIINVVIDIVGEENTY